MAQSLEALVEDFGGVAEVNHIWRSVSGSDFIDQVLWDGMGEAVTVELGDSCTIVLLGTAHTSQRSAHAAADLARSFRPDCLVLERCHKRLGALTMPKTSVMDYTVAERMVDVEGEVLDAQVVHRMLPAEVELVADTAQRLWARYTLLNEERNALVEEAAFVEFARQCLLSGGPRILCLADLPTSPQSPQQAVPSSRQGLLGTLPERDTHIATSIIAAHKEAGSRRILAILGAHHIKGVAHALRAFHTDPKVLDGLVCGTFLDRRGVAEVAMQRGHWSAMIEAGVVPPSELIDLFNEAVEKSLVMDRLQEEGFATKAKSCQEFRRWWWKSNLVGQASRI